MNTLRIKADHFNEIKDKLFQFSPKEAVAFGLGGVYDSKSGKHFMVREIIFPDKNDYLVQEELQLKVSPMFLNKIISKAERENLTVVSFHTHPFSSKEVRFSEADDYGENITAKTINDCLGKPYASVVIGKNSSKARIWLDQDKALEVQQIRMLGQNLIYLNNQSIRNKENIVNNEKFSRQIMAFGKDGQDFISSLKIGIVGIGGTGSSLTEQLARMGATDYVLVDFDEIEESNKTRVYGTYIETRGKKTDIARANIMAINPDVKIEIIDGNVMSLQTIGRLLDCDFIFSCLDRHAPRSILNELSYQYYIPIIDMGAGLGVKDSKINGGSVRATLVGPGLPCLFCQKLISPDVISAESLPKEERLKLIKEGYVPGLNEEPSVINFTNMAASFAVTMFTDVLFDYSQEKTRNIIFTLDDFRTLNYRVKGDDCVCGVREGYGDYKHLSI